MGIFSRFTVENSLPTKMPMDSRTTSLTHYYIQVHPHLRNAKMQFLRSESKQVHFEPVSIIIIGANCDCLLGNLFQFPNSTVLFVCVCIISMLNISIKYGWYGYGVLKEIESMMEISGKTALKWSFG